MYERSSSQTRPSVSRVFGEGQRPECSVKTQSLPLVNQPQEEHKDMSWSQDQLQGFFDFPLPDPQADSSRAMVHSKGEWPDWANQLISVDDSLEPNWSELLGDPNVVLNQDSKVCVSRSLHMILCFLLSKALMMCCYR